MIKTVRIRNFKAIRNSGPIRFNDLSATDVYTLTYEMYFARYGRSGANIYKHLLLNPQQNGQPFMQIRKRTLNLFL